MPQFGPDGYIPSFTHLFSFSYRLDRLLIRFDGKRKIRSFNLVQRPADGMLIPKLQQAVSLIDSNAVYFFKYLHHFHGRIMFISRFSFEEKFKIVYKIPVYPVKPDIT